MCWTTASSGTKAQSKAVQRGLDHLRLRIDGDLSCNAHLRLSLPFFQFPRVQRLRGGHAQANAFETEKIFRRFRKFSIWQSSRVSRR